jgi:glycogen debranching enzyme
LIASRYAVRTALFGAARFLALAALFSLWPFALSAQTIEYPQLSRSARPWTSISALGEQSAIFGDESGRLEAWVYPLKILRNFQLRFITGSYVESGADMARSVTVRPESTTILYVGDTFTVRETIFVPIHQQGAVITIDVSTSQPIEVEVHFERDFQLMWPGSIGGSYLNWDETMHAFWFADDLNQYSALVGSPDAAGAVLDYGSYAIGSNESSFRLTTFRPGHESKAIFIAGSARGRDDVSRIYKQILGHAPELATESKSYYESYLERTVQLDLPDRDLQRAYDWSRISVVQGLVEAPNVGTGLVAGYRAAEDGLRPGFAWFFGRDSMWTSLALNAESDYSTSRTALNFLLKYQRADGKIPHEVVQTADVVPWFAKYPYAYGSADATPLLLIGADDYVRRSGDVDFAKQNWDELYKTYQFLKSTETADGFAQNRGVGHGWIEGGPLYPADVEFYQAALAIQAGHSLADLAVIAGKPDLAKSTETESESEESKLNEKFWSPEKGYFVFSLNQTGQQSGPLTALATVPMWFRLLESGKTETTINRLSNPEYESDWGMRLLSNKDPDYGPSGYHCGSVWPLFTGWASVGEYQYHRALAGYSNLRANAMLALDGSLGHTTEVLSGNQYTALSGSTSDQIWSAAMVISPLLRGMLGLEVDAIAKRVSFTPHVPADWNAFSVRNIQIGAERVDLRYRRESGEVSLRANSAGESSVTLDFNPAISLRANVIAVELNGHAVPFRIAPNSEDQHVQVSAQLGAGSNELRIRTRNDFGLAVPYLKPEAGDASRNLRVVRESWSTYRDTLTEELEGIAGETYVIDVMGQEQVRSIEGGDVVQSPDGRSGIRVRIPDATSGDKEYASTKVVIHLTQISESAKHHKQ